jgi:hypothetical protein
MLAFAAAGVIAAVSATTTEAAASSSSQFDASRYYSYGYGSYAYPSFDHKEELTPVKVHHKKARTYKTNNIDIFAHSDSDSDDSHHGYGYGHHSSHSSDSSSSEDDHAAHKKHHPVFLTGYGPEGDHCHPGDYCGEAEEPSDYTDSDY